MQITQGLLGEHAVFYAQFSYLEKAVPTSQNLGEVQIQTALLDAGLESHANLEEELLFVHLEPHLGTQGGPLAVMRAEHDEIKNGLSRLPQLQNLDEAQNLLLHVIAVAREHFAKEEQILYPMAEQTLGEEKLMQLGSEWARQRKVACS
jgi:hemerythrin-like domain-containing protein